MHLTAEDIPRLTIEDLLRVALEAENDPIPNSRSESLDVPAILIVDTESGTHTDIMLVDSPTAQPTSKHTNIHTTPESSSASENTRLDPRGSQDVNGNSPLREIDELVGDLYK